MEHSTLKLTVDKGPREGQTLDCTTRSVIKIGRVVKGNTFTIKDSGISSNHLRIEFKNNKWVISDLDSSNGTFVNGTKIQPLKDFHLRDESVIKIGEWTSFKVQIVEHEVVNVEEEYKPTRGNRKTSKNVAVAEKIDAKNVEEQQVRKIPSRRAATRNTRASSKVEETESELASLSIMEKVSQEPDNVANVAAPTRPRRGRSRKAKDEPVLVQRSPKSMELASEIREEPKIVVPVKEKKTRRGALKKVEGSKDGPITVSEVPTISGNDNADQEGVKEVPNVDPIAEEKEERSSAPREDEPQNMAPLEKKSTRRVAQRKVKTSKEKEPPESAGIEVIKDSGNPNNEEELERKFCEEPGSSSGVKENLVPPGYKKIDWEKLTLGEWFDYMEVDLTKYVHERTDEIISSMRERSQQFNEFMLQQQREGKGKFPL